MRELDLGRVTSTLQGRVVAGSLQTMEVEYTAGFSGIDDTGSLKFVMRYATDCGTPQFEDPSGANFTTAIASNGARLQLRYDLKDNIRPWGKTIHVKVLQGFLREGDTIRLVLGDRSQGSPGWRTQTFLESTWELRVLVDRFATYVYEPVPQPPLLVIVASEPVRLVAVAPSHAKPNRKVTVRCKLEDAWGNPVGKPWKQVFDGFEAGVHRVSIVHQPTSLTATTNALVVDNGLQHRVFWADLHGQSEETIGTNTIDQYFRFGRDFGFLDACAHQGNDFQITDDFWSEIQSTTSQYNRAGRYVTFPGWEWSGNTALGGDRNVLFLDEGGPIHRSSRALVDRQQSQDDCCPAVESLFQRMHAYNGQVMSVPHVGGRFADLERHDTQLEPNIEVHSAWGTFEWMLEDAFRLGYRVGIVANSDGHKGRPGASYPGASTFGSYGGLTGILTNKLDRQHVWDAYQARRVYATTGARIVLDTRIDDDLPMGAVVECPVDASLQFSFRVHGTATIERVEIRNGMRVLETLRPQRTRARPKRIRLLWQGAEVRGRGRQVNWDGRLELTDNRIRRFHTINFHNLEQPCVQIDDTRLKWSSNTTGGVAGVILELKSANDGQIAVKTTQKSFKAKLSKIDESGRRFDAGGIEKRISIQRLRETNRQCDLDGSLQLTGEHLNRGDNPIYIHVVQEDGHMAWSSPHYVTRS